MVTPRVLATLGIVAILGFAFLKDGGRHPALAAAGDLDLSFGPYVDGSTFADFSGFWDQAAAVAVQPDGKIVVAGTDNTSLYSWNVAVARFCPNGRLDDGVNCGVAGFGTGGLVSTNFDSKRCGGAAALGLQTDGKIVVAGCGNPVPSTGDTNSMMLVRYLPSGILDPAFGSGGAAFGPPTHSGAVISHATALAIQPDGSIVAAGTALVPESPTAFCPTCYDFAVLRFTASGSPDYTFGAGGWTFVDLNGDKDEAYALARQSDGKLVVAGQTVAGGITRFGMVRLCQDGKIDDGSKCGSGLGSSGVITTSIGTVGDLARAVAIQPDGRILVAGGTLTPNFMANVALVRYHTNGASDASFGVGGIVLSAFAHLGAVPSSATAVIVYLTNPQIPGTLSVRYTGGGCHGRDDQPFHAGEALLR